MEQPARAGVDDAASAQAMPSVRCSCWRRAAALRGGALAVFRFSTSDSLAGCRHGRRTFCLHPRHLCDGANDPASDLNRAVNIQPSIRNRFSKTSTV